MTTPVSEMESIERLLAADPADENTYLRLAMILPRMGETRSAFLNGITADLKARNPLELSPGQIAYLAAELKFVPGLDAPLPLAEFKNLPLCLVLHWNRLMEQALALNFDILECTDERFKSQSRKILDHIEKTIDESDTELRKTYPDLNGTENCFLKKIEHYIEYSHPECFSDLDQNAIHFNGWIHYQFKGRTYSMHGYNGDDGYITYSDVTSDMEYHFVSTQEQRVRLSAFTNAPHLTEGIIRAFSSSAQKVQDHHGQNVLETDFIGFKLRLHRDETMDFILSISFPNCRGILETVQLEGEDHDRAMGLWNRLMTVDQPD